MNASQPTTITAQGVNNDSFAYLSATHCLGVAISMVRLSRVGSLRPSHKAYMYIFNFFM